MTTLSISGLISAGARESIDLFIRPMRLDIPFFYYVFTRHFSGFLYFIDLQAISHTFTFDFFFIILTQ